MSEISTHSPLKVVLGVVATIIAVMGIIVLQAGRNESRTETAANLLARHYPAKAGAQHLARSAQGLMPGDAKAAVAPVFPHRFSEPVAVRNGSAQVIATPVNGSAASTAAVAMDGSLIYANAFEDCDIAYRCNSEKAEEFLIVHSARQPISSWSWELNLGSGESRLLPVLTDSGRVELRDRAGVIRLCIDAPEGKDDSGMLLRFGERLNYNLADAGDGVALLTLTADLRGARFPVVIDPSWSSGGNMTTARADHTATVMADGKVLIVGGLNSTSLDSVEVYDPDLESFTAVTSLNTARRNHSATLLQDGRVLVAGGIDSLGNDLASAEIYDPNNDTWTPAGSLNIARSRHTDTLMNDGRVLVTGGTGPLMSAEVFDPLAGANGTWTSVPDMTEPRVFHTAVLLPDGTVQVAGGDVGGLTETESVDIFDPSSDTFAVGKPMIVKRRVHQAVLLNTSDVLFIGGFNPGLFPSAELFRTATNGTDPTGSMSRPRTEHRVAVLADGKVLTMGCNDGSFANVEYYDPLTLTWTVTASALLPHTRHTLTTLPNKKVLLVGGVATGVTAAAELYDPSPDPNGQTLTASGPTPLSITLGSTALSSTVTYAVATQPTNGVLTGTAPNLVYTANAGYVGSDSFTFTASDFFTDGVILAPKSATVSITVNSIAPTLTSATPDAAIAGSAGFTISITGENFVPGATVRWNNSDRTTTFVSTTLVTADIPASDIAAPGSAAVTVFNPAPGGGISNTLTVDVLGGALGIWNVANTDDSGTNSLRWAMKNARSGDSIIFDSVVFDLDNASAATVINILSELPAMDKGSVTLDASNRRVTINGSGAGSSCGILITSNSNKVMGLNIIGFTKSGVCLSGANSNIIGGNRSLPAIGTGPNGEGLRIGSCGAFGIEVSTASCDNIIKGCWIGLDASGSSAESNLAGIIIQSGSCRNQIGSSVAEEANVISGNRFEGVTVTGAGTDDNIVIGNNIGAAGVDPVISRSVGVASRDESIFGRAPVGNGNAGVFLSKGTNDTNVGGDDDTGGNSIGFNGGSGVEVRAANSRRNKSRRNRISRNLRGGIALFDGSNNNVQAPVIDQVTPVTPTTASREDSLPTRVNMKGSTETDGTVEVFTDPGEQGASFAGRANVVGGQFEIELDVPAGENITATFTDAEGNTSPFAVFGQAPATSKPTITSALTLLATVNEAFSSTITASGTQPITYTVSTLPAGLSLSGDTISGTPTELGTFTVTLTATNGGGTTITTLVIVVGMPGFSTVDTDGDGVIDILESLAGTDTGSAASSPLVQDSVSIDRVQFKLNFSKPGKDSLTVLARLTLPTAFTASGTLAGVQFGSVSKANLTLDSKGRSPKGTSVITVRSAATGSSSIAVVLSIKNEDLTALLAASGFTNVTVAETVVVVPVAVALTTGGQTVVYSSQVSVKYKATLGKTGIGKR